ncbi:MAG TPA: response regulator [Tepidisphaeraceae bacterium]|jgi:two-component system phosphate regulon response regulator PhoB|nr:response regulator [Tepidisphaeraceae bacterium]
MKQTAPDQTKTCAKSVLVVEDDPEINAMVGAYAELCGFQYRPALSGAGAMQQVKEGTPTIVILDLMLPDADGFEICRTMRKNASMQRVPIIILTALGGEKNRQKGIACGATDYMTKPFDPDHLMKTIEKHANANGQCK